MSINNELQLLETSPSIHWAICVKPEMTYLGLHLSELFPICFLAMFSGFYKYHICRGLLKSRTAPVRPLQFDVCTVKSRCHSFITEFILDVCCNGLLHPPLPLLCSYWERLNFCFKCVQLYSSSYCLYSLFIAAFNHPFSQTFLCVFFFLFVSI